MRSEVKGEENNRIKVKCRKARPQFHSNHHNFHISYTPHRQASFPQRLLNSFTLFPIPIASTPSPYSHTHTHPVVFPSHECAFPSHECVVTPPSLHIHCLIHICHHFFASTSPSPPPLLTPTYTPFLLMVHSPTTHLFPQQHNYRPRRTQLTPQQHKAAAVDRRH
jgi:hypothetical protein